MLIDTVGEKDGEMEKRREEFRAASQAETAKPVDQIIYFVPVSFKLNGSGRGKQMIDE
jgi:hypothetical protein